jgi:2-polyprenyl-6-methoxyphenol hydroxylase-like FAD-dependent oxidoreductase
MAEPQVHHIPIAIVGGGPVGLMLALFLDRHGVPSVVFNTEPSARHHPKGSTHNSRTMEHYRRLGFGAQVRRLGLPVDHPTDVVYLTRFNGPELARLRMPSGAEKMQRVAASPRSDQVPEPIHRANQMYVEKFLLQHAATRPNITLRFGWRVDSFLQDADGVTLHAEAADASGDQNWRAKYLVGCDGGRSFVRRTLGIQYEGFAALEQAFFGTHMISTYLRAPTLYRDYLGSRRAWQYWVVNPELRTGLVALNGDDEFIVWSRSAPDRPPDDATIAALVRRATGAKIPLDIIAHGEWTGGIALTAERFADRRVLLAGDAVHLFTPTGGFGMNTGIADAANLAWKLAAIAQGWGGAGLLASYEAERKPIAVRNTSASRALAKNVGDILVPAELEQNSPAGAAARATTGAFLSGFGEEFASIGVQLGARYDGSPIIMADGDPPPDSFVRYTPSSVPGGRAPHYWLDDTRAFGSSLFDRLGVGFTLLRLRPEVPDPAALLAAAAVRKIPLAVVDVPDAEARDLYERDLALIRPDQHVAWRGNAAPHDPGALWARLTGAS